MTKRQEVHVSRQDQQNSGTPIHELPQNLVASTLAHLAQGYWEGRHAKALRSLSKIDSYVLGQLLENKQALHKALVDFKGKNFFARAKERIIYTPLMILKDVNDFDLGRRGVILEDIEKRKNFCLSDLELIPLFSKGGKNLSEVINSRDPSWFVSYTAMRALWLDSLEHAMDDHSGVLSELVRKIDPGDQPKRIFCGQKVTKGKETSGFPCIVNNSRMWSEAEYELVEKGDFLLIWKTPE